MPELPEVETIRKGLEKYILNKKITKLTIYKDNLIHANFDFFYKSLVNHKIVSLDRIGKLLIFYLDNNLFLLIHLKLTGQLIYKASKDFVAGGHKLRKVDLEVPNKYSYVIFDFDDNSNLYLNDMRQFAYLRIVDERELNLIKSQYGIEPLTANWTFSNFLKIVNKHKKAKLKAFLLNQKYIAGLGNIYVDETAFCAKVLPWRKVGDLSEKEIKAIFNCITKIIQMALKHNGTTFKDYRDTEGRAGNYSDYLKVFHKQGQLCSRCKKAIIKKIKVAGRGTHYCPNCQH